MKVLLGVLVGALLSFACFAQSLFDDQMRLYEQWLTGQVKRVNAGEVSRSAAYAEASDLLAQIKPTEPLQQAYLNNHSLLISKIQVLSLQLESGKINMEEFVAQRGLAQAEAKAVFQRIQSEHRQAATAERERSSQGIINGLILLDAARRPAYQSPSINCTSRQVFNTVQTTCN